MEEVLDDLLSLRVAAGHVWIPDDGARPLAGSYWIYGRLCFSQPSAPDLRVDWGRGRNRGHSPFGFSGRRATSEGHAIIIVIDLLRLARGATAVPLVHSGIAFLVAVASQLDSFFPENLGKLFHILVVGLSI